MNALGDFGISSNLITYCKVSIIKSGLLQFTGDGFTLNMRYSDKVVKPRIEYIEVTDKKLKTYWPNGVTRVIMEFINPKPKGYNQMIILAEQ